MTNVEGIGVLIVQLILIGVCLGVSGLLVLVHGWTRWREDAGIWAYRISAALSNLAIGVSVLSWAMMFLVFTPGVLRDELLALNPLLVAVLFVFTVPAILGGYVRKSGPAEQSPSSQPA